MSIPPQYTLYFDAMAPGQILEVGSSKDQDALIKYAKCYIDNNKGLLEFNTNYTRIKKLLPFGVEAEKFNK